MPFLTVTWRAAGPGSRTVTRYTACTDAAMERAGATGCGDRPPGGPWVFLAGPSREIHRLSPRRLRILSDGHRVAADSLPKRPMCTANETVLSAFLLGPSQCSDPTIPELAASRPPGIVRQTPRPRPVFTPAAAQTIAPSPRPSRSAAEPVPAGPAREPDIGSLPDNIVLPPIRC